VKNVRKPQIAGGDFFDSHCALRCGLQNITAITALVISHELLMFFSDKDSFVPPNVYNG